MSSVNFMAICPFGNFGLIVVLEERSEGRKNSILFGIDIHCPQGMLWDSDYPYQIHSNLTHSKISCKMDEGKIVQWLPKFYGLVLANSFKKHFHLRNTFICETFLVINSTAY